MQQQIVTTELLNTIEAYVKEHGATIKAEASLPSEPAVLLYGAYVGYKQQPTYGAAQWLVSKYQRYTDIKAGK